MRMLLLSLLLAGMSKAEEQVQDSFEQLTSCFFAAARTGDLVVLNGFLQQGCVVVQRNCEVDSSKDVKTPVTDKQKMTVAQFAVVFGQSEKL